jgi:hypothetical protein
LPFANEIFFAGAGFIPLTLDGLVPVGTRKGSSKLIKLFSLDFFSAFPRLNRMIMVLFKFEFMNSIFHLIKVTLMIVLILNG